VTPADMLQELFTTNTKAISALQICICEDDEERLYSLPRVLDDNGNAIETKAVEEDGELKYWLKGFV
jgi:hypothetical protein